MGIHHFLSVNLTFLGLEHFDALYIGTGHNSALPITSDALKLLKKYEAVISSTPEIIGKLEQEQRKFVAIIHVTC